MSKSKIDKEVTSAMTKLTQKADAVVADLIEWITHNKTKILVVVGIYLALKFLFGEETVEPDDEQE